MSVVRLGDGEGGLAVYREHPRIGRLEAIRRYNALADQLELDVPGENLAALAAAIAERCDLDW